MIAFAQQFRILSLRKWRRWRRHRPRWQRLPSRGRSESWECCRSRFFCGLIACSLLNFWKDAADFDAWEIIHTAKPFIIYVFVLSISPKGCNKFFMPYIFQLVIWVQLNTAAQKKKKPATQNLGNSNCNNSYTRNKSRNEIKNTQPTPPIVLCVYSVTWSWTFTVDKHGVVLNFPI